MSHPHAWGHAVLEVSLPDLGDPLESPSYTVQEAEGDSI